MALIVCGVCYYHIVVVSRDAECCAHVGYLFAIWSLSVIWSCWYWPGMYGFKVNCTGNDGPFFCVNVSVSRYPCDEDERVMCGVVYPYGFIGRLAGTVWWLYACMALIVRGVCYYHILVVSRDVECCAHVGYLFVSWRLSFIWSCLYWPEMYGFNVNGAWACVLITVPMLHYWHLVITRFN